MSQSEVHRYRVGRVDVMAVSDGFRMGNLAGYVTNATEDAVKTELAEAGLPTDKLKTGFAPILLDDGRQRVLVDTGNGDAAFRESEGQVGRLLQNLSAAGIERDSIDVVVISHFHADHVNGLLMADGSRAFPKAEIRVPEPEWRFWMDDTAMAAAPEGRMKGLFQNNRRVFDALERKVTTFPWKAEAVPGLTAMGTPGHSIGHTSFMLESDGAKLFVQGDVCNQSVVFAHHPEWQGWFDQDPEQAVRTRMEVYAMLADQKIPVQAYHFPWPARGMVTRRGSGFHVEAVA